MSDFSRDFIDRRSFLRAAAGVGAGTALGLFVTIPVSRNVNEQVSDATGHPAGNASWDQMVKDECAQESDPQQCEKDYKPTIDDKIDAQVMAPLMEEIMFRGIPSFILDAVNDEKDNDPPEVIAGGTEPFRFSRKELLVGAATSVAFGAAHNITSKGINTETIPASQTVVGFSFWCLMRRFGIASSMAAHSAHNYRALRVGK